MSRRIHWWAAAAMAAVLILIPAGVHYWGVFNVAADDEHWAVTRGVLESVRERSVAARAVNIPVPDLENEWMIASGASHYDEMCSGCHLAPGVRHSDLREGLNPQPPDLTRAAGERGPAEKFWIIKHGLKLTGMPAWGRTHDDASLWGIVAFLERLPRLDAAGYQSLLARGGPHEDDGHHHERDTHQDHDQDHDDHDRHDTHDEDNAAARPSASRSSP